MATLPSASQYVDITSTYDWTVLDVLGPMNMAQVKTRRYKEHSNMTSIGMSSRREDIVHNEGTYINVMDVGY